MFVTVAIVDSKVGIGVEVQLCKESATEAVDKVEIIKGIST